jgi:Protein of unknown function (DUF2442)
VNSLPSVLSVEHLGDYRLRVEFDDGLVREIDLERILQGPVFQELRDPVAFGQVFVDHDSGTIAWPNEVDLDPEVLHGDAVPNSGPALNVLAEFRR